MLLRDTRANSSSLSLVGHENIRGNLRVETFKRPFEFDEDGNNNTTGIAYLAYPNIYILIKLPYIMPNAIIAIYLFPTLLTMKRLTLSL